MVQWEGCLPDVEDPDVRVVIFLPNLYRRLSIISHLVLADVEDAFGDQERLATPRLQHPVTPHVGLKVQGRLILQVREGRFSRKIQKLCHFRPHRVSAFTITGQRQELHP